MSAASNALWRSGRASVTRRTSPSRRTSRPASVTWSRLGKLGEHRLDLAEDVCLLVAKVVQIRVESGENEAQLGSENVKLSGVSIRCHGPTT